MTNYAMKLILQAPASRTHPRLNPARLFGRGVVTLRLSGQSGSPRTSTRQSGSFSIYRARVATTPRTRSDYYLPAICVPCCASGRRRCCATRFPPGRGCAPSSRSPPSRPLRSRHGPLVRFASRQTPSLRAESEAGAEENMGLPQRFEFTAPQRLPTPALARVP
jgi:hypothetical protein